MFRTEYEFTLPRGFVDADGQLHREGLMSLSTAADEILPLRDPRVQKNPAYLVVILLSRVVSRLGNLKGDEINPGVIEKMYAADLAYLQDFYNEINQVDASDVPVTCPHCQHAFTMERPSLGGS